MERRFYVLSNLYRAISNLYDAGYEANKGNLDELKLKMKGPYDSLQKIHNELLEELRKEMTVVELHWNTDNKSIIDIYTHNDEHKLLKSFDIGADDEEVVVDYCNENKLCVLNKGFLDTFYREGLWYHYIEKST